MSTASFVAGGVFGSYSEVTVATVVSATEFDRKTVWCLMNFSFLNGGNRGSFELLPKLRFRFDAVELVPASWLFQQPMMGVFLFSLLPSGLVVPSPCQLSMAMLG